MKRVFIGHRGVGKSSLLERHKTYFSDIPHFDLDQEIEKIAGMSISEIFNSQGEERFRETEQSVYEDLISKNFSYVIAVGAGFPVADLQPTDEIIYVSRVTDADGRLFLNRPRLNPDLGPLEESKLRYQERNPHFLKYSKKIYFLPEGLETISLNERRILAGEYKITDAIYTLSAQEIPEIENLMRSYFQIELRTDLISSESIQLLTNSYPEFSWLVSYRNSNVVPLSPQVRVDWEIGLGAVPSYLQRNANLIISSHVDSIQLALQSFSTNPQAHLKLCPLIENFADLKLGYEWQQKDPQNRSFLPRSKEGCWLWYRQLAKYLQKLNFIRNYSLMLDQPSAFEWLALPDEKPEAWAAVLGRPIYFSRTPLQHKKYFTLKKTFVSKINLSVEEFKNYLPWLISLKLTYAAITSPLKEIAYEISTTRTETANQFKAVNTLYLKDLKIEGHNTDVDGFKYLTRAIDPKEHVAVWGGGGTLKVIFSVLPEAFYFSSQTAHERSARSFDPNLFKILIWAAPRSEKTVFPSSEFAFQEIVDLNYVENSMGLEYAIDRNIKYTSGLDMFREQALKQQEYWSSK